MQPGHPQYPPMPAAPVASVATLRWWTFPLTTAVVAVVVGLVAAAPSPVGVAAGAGVLLCSLVAAGVCLVRTPRHPRARPLGLGFVWAVPVGLVVLVVVLATVTVTG